MDLATINKMIKKARQSWEINSVLMHDAKIKKNPEAYLYAKKIVKYIRVIERLEKSKKNYQ